MGGSVSKSGFGTDIDDAKLNAGGVVVDNGSFDETLDRVYDIRGAKNIRLTLINEDLSNAIDWVWQTTEDIVPDGGDMTGATWADISAEAELALDTTVKAAFVRTNTDITAIRIRTKEAIPASSATIGGRVVYDNGYLD